LQYMRIKRDTLGEQVYEMLRKRILSGELTGGKRLVQGELSDEIGTSRIPVRDALKRLETDGLIIGDEIGRYTVVPFSPKDVSEVYAIRRRLEPLAAATATRLMPDETLSDIQSLYDELGSAARRNRLERYTELNIQFHMVLYEASGMRRLVRIIRSLYQGVPPLTLIVLEGRIEHSQLEHQQIVERLVARDADGVAEMIERHIANAEGELLDAMAKNKGRKSGKAAPQRK
jgi:DNA-binding GntR family transcriptional regulator